MEKLLLQERDESLAATSAVVPEPAVEERHALIKSPPLEKLDSEVAAFLERMDGIDPATINWEAELALLYDLVFRE